MGQPQLVKIVIIKKFLNNHKFTVIIMSLKFADCVARFANVNGKNYNVSICLKDSTISPCYNEKLGAKATTFYK